MQARALIQNASFGPDALKAIGQAFDAAWADIEGNFGEEPERVAAARLKLANAMLAVADNDSRDVQALSARSCERWPKTTGLVESSRSRCAKSYPQTPEPQSELASHSSNCT